MTALTPPQMYRTILKQFVKNSIHPRLERSPSITLHLRKLFESSPTSKPELEKLRAQSANMVVYLKSHRLHKELVERYNPTSTLSAQERARMSAGMVGLNMPTPFDPSKKPTMESNRMQGIKEGSTGSLQSIMD